MHPLRTPASTTLWQRLCPALHLLNSALRRKDHKSRRLVLQPAAGGRCKKRPIVYEPPATEPVRFRMGIGPSLDPTGLAYYRRPDHLRTNRTKNRGPGHSKTLVCNIVKDTDYQDPIYYGQLHKLASGKRLGTLTASIRAGTAAVQNSRDPSRSMFGLC